MRTAVVWGVLAVGVAGARGAAPVPAVGPNAGVPTELTASLRGLLLQSLPAPLYEDSKHWGGQKEVTRGLKWTGQGLDFHAEPQRSLKNDGLWWRVKVTAPNVGNSLVFEIRDVATPETGKTTFTAFVAFDTDIDYERQRWDAGHRIFAASVRGRARVTLVLHCEATSRLENKFRLVPDLYFRVRVTAADFHYDHVVFEHVAGVGGDGAKLIGDAARASLRIWRPSLERRLVEKADAAIVKAGDTKEVCVGLGKLFDRKK